MHGNDILSIMNASDGRIIRTHSNIEIAPFGTRTKIWFLFGVLGNTFTFENEIMNIIPIAPPLLPL